MSNQTNMAQADGRSVVYGVPWLMRDYDHRHADR
jgi:hypothetical protein